MLIFDQCRISDNGSRLYLDFHVNFADYFDNIMLDSVTITTADKVLETNPKTPSDDYIYKKIYTQDLQVDHIVIDKGVLDAAFNNWNGEKVLDDSKPHAKTPFNENNFSNNLFFIYVKCKGVPSECTPCTLDEEITLAVTFDEGMFYQKVMQLTKELTQDCTIPKEFSDLILLWNGFKAAVETEHYIPAYKFWQMMFEEGTLPTYNHKPCGCHG